MEQISEIKDVESECGRQELLDIISALRKAEEARFKEEMKSQVLDAVSDD